jgi:hypothetical protein
VFVNIKCSLLHRQSVREHRLRKLRRRKIRHGEKFNPPQWFGQLKVNHNLPLPASIFPIISLMPPSPCYLQLLHKCAYAQTKRALTGCWCTALIGCCARLKSTRKWCRQAAGQARYTNEYPTAITVDQKVRSSGAQITVGCVKTVLGLVGWYNTKMRRALF